MKTSYPLIRRTPTGWERLVIGCVAGGVLVYEPCAWDHAAWEARQKCARAIRAGLVLEMPTRVEVELEAV